MVFLQKKKQILRKAGRGMASAVCLLSLVLMAAGCGKVEEPIPVQLSSGNVEELQNNSNGEIEDDPGAAAVRDKESDLKDISADAAKVDAGDDMNENAGNSPENNATQKAIQTDNEWDTDENIRQTEDAQPQSVGIAELEGNVKSIGTDSFVAVRHEVWEEKNASYAVGAAPGYEDEEDLITVHVSQNCVWEFKTVKNGGINSEDVSTREGSFADLQEGIAIRIKGSWQSDGSFLADRIVMMIFV